MKVTGVTMVKNEADIIGTTLRWMLGQVDSIVVADNGSTDGTGAVLLEVAQQYHDRVTILWDGEPGYYQSEKMSALSDQARAAGAFWVVPFDADELWSPAGAEETHRTVKDVLHHATEGGYEYVQASLFDYLCTDHDDPDETNPVARMRWRRRTPVPLPKVAVRALAGLQIHQGNHGAGVGGLRFPERVIRPGFPLMIRHYSNRSPDQFQAKVRVGAAAYAASTLPETMGTHWREFGRMSDDQLRLHWADELWIDNPESDPSIVFDPITNQGFEPGNPPATRTLDPVEP